MDIAYLRVLIYRRNFDTILLLLGDSPAEFKKKVIVAAVVYSLIIELSSDDIWFDFTMWIDIEGVGRLGDVEEYKDILREIHQNHRPK